MVEKYYNLIKAIKEQETGEDLEGTLDFLRREMSRFPAYVNTVYRMEIEAPVNYSLYSGKELQEKIMELDTSRRLAHESAIVSCNAINRLCDIMGVEKLCPVSDDRKVIADFAGEIVNKFFVYGTKEKEKTLEELLQDMKEDGIKKVSKTMIREER